MFRKFFINRASGFCSYIVGVMNITAEAAAAAAAERMSFLGVGFVWQTK
jgi:thiamine monophosphate synthase